MKRFISAVIAACMFAAPLAAMAQNSEGIEEVIISASPHAKPANQLAGSVNLLEGDALRAELSATLGETLKNQLGVNSSSFGSAVGVPVIRGQSGHRVEILQNGTQVADVSDTSADHAIATEALLATRIEILRGPATLRYGTGAMGGVVNVIDHRIDNETLDGVEGALEARYDTNNEEHALVGRVDFGSGNLRLHLDGSTRDAENTDIPGLAANQAVPDALDPDETTDGHIGNSDREADAFTLGLSYVTDNLIGGLSVYQMDNNYGLPPGTHEHGHEEEHAHEDEDEEEADGMHEDEHGEEPLVRLDLEQTQIQGKLQFLQLGGNLERLDLDLNYTDYEHRENEFHEGENEGGTLFDVDSVELRSELVHRDIGGWRGALGLQYSDRDFVAADAHREEEEEHGEGETHATGPDADAHDDEHGHEGELFVPPSKTEVWGLYLLEERQLGSGTLELGLRYDRQTVSPRPVGDDHNHEDEAEEDHHGETHAEDEHEDESIPDIDHNSFNLSASYSLPLDDRQKLGLVFSRTERAPAAEELLSEGRHIATNTYEVGDESLDSESSINVELNWAYEDGERMQAKAGLFFSDFKDYIYARDSGLRFSEMLADVEEHGDLDAVCRDDKTDTAAAWGGNPMVADSEAEEAFEEALPCFEYRQENARFYGLEAEASFAISPGHRLRLWGDSVRAELDDSGDVPRMPPARLGARWDFAQSRWQANLSVMHALDQNRAGKNEDETEGYTRLDAYLAYRLDALSLFAKGSNLTDEEIRNATSFVRNLAPEPGRGLTLGMRYSF